MAYFHMVLIGFLVLHFYDHFLHFITAFQHFCV